MKFSVVWQPDAEAQLAELWTRSSDRAALASAANHIERVLRSYPEQVGEDRFDEDRVMFEEPLGLMFRLILEDRLVQVLRVWDITRR